MSRWAPPLGVSQFPLFDGRVREQVARGKEVEIDLFVCVQLPKLVPVGKPTRTLGRNEVE